MKYLEQIAGPSLVSRWQYKQHGRIEELEVPKLEMKQVVASATA